MALDIFTLLARSEELQPTEPQEKSKKDDDQLQSILYAQENMKSFAEDGDFDSADGFGDFVGDDAMSMPGVDNAGDTGGMSDMGGGGLDDGGFGGDSSGMMGDFGGDDQQGQDGNVPGDALDFLENLDESEVDLVSELLGSFSNMYADQMRTYERLLGENLTTSKYAETAAKIQEGYKITLKVLLNYIQNRYKKDTTMARVEAFLRFKKTFNDLSNSINEILDGIE